MPEPQPGGNDFDEPEIAGFGFVVAGRQPSGVFQLVDAAFDHVAKGVEIRIWIEKFEAGAYDDEAHAADLLQEHEAKVAALERLVGRQAMEIELSQRGL